MRGTLFLIAVLFCPFESRAEQPGRYLEAVQTFADTIIQHGTDRYGEVHSPLFAAMLDLKTLSLPVASLPPEFYRGAGMHNAYGFGLPDPPVGIRPTDRSPTGNNLDHDIMLLRTMYELSAATGEKKYADHANAYLRFWLRNCQSPETGLMATGEHSSWDFLRERTYGGIHEVFRRFPLWEKLYAIDPYRTLRLADALWMSQIGDKRRGDYSRHAYIDFYKPDTGAAYPRHAGFYIDAYAQAYVQSRDPKYIERIEVLIESRTGIRPQPWSLLVQPGDFTPEGSTDPTLRVLLWDAAELVPSRRETWQAIVRKLDDKAFAQPVTEKLSSASIAKVTTAELKNRAQPLARLETTGRKLQTIGGFRTESTTLSPLWKIDYGSSGASGRALLDYTRYLQNGDRRFLEKALGTAEELVAEGLPRVKQDLWPRASGQVISLMVALSKDAAVPEASRKRFLSFAEAVAGMSLDLFSRNGLFRADGTAEHYEAQTGADDLLWGLLQLDRALHNSTSQLPHNDVNW